MKAQVSGQQIHIGAERLMQQLGLNVDIFKEKAQQLGEQGRTPLYVAIDQKLAAIIAVADPIKATTYSAIQALHDQGLKIAMITGDNQHTAQAIAKQLKIDHVIAEVLPNEKSMRYANSNSNMASSLLSVTGLMMHLPWLRPMSEWQ